MPRDPPAYSSLECNLSRSQVAPCRHHFTLDPCPGCRRESLENRGGYPGASARVARSTLRPSISWTIASTRRTHSRGMRLNMKSFVDIVCRGVAFECAPPRPWNAKYCSEAYFAPEAAPISTTCAMKPHTWAKTTLNNPLPPPTLSRFPLGSVFGHVLGPDRSRRRCGDRVTDRSARVHQGGAAWTV